MRNDSGRGRLTGWLTAAGVVLFAIGLAGWLLQSPTASTTDPTGAAPAAGAPASGPVLEPARAPREPGAPRRLVVPALGVDAPVVPIVSVDDTLVPPSDPQRLGWWADGAKPGAARGSALVTGHTVNAGGGALDDLETLEPGDRVVVRTDRGRLAYVVRDVRVFSKGAVSDHAERLFSQDVPGRLVLITCEDWNGEVYLSNVVVTAVPASR